MKVTFSSSNELDNLNSHDVLYRLSLAYIDSAINLCQAMNNKRLKQTYSRGNVILYLFYHSTELFLKAFILKNNLSGKLVKFNSTKMHDLESLNEILFNANIKIDLPFKYEYSKDQINVNNKKMPIDQIYKYHIGKDWKKYKMTGSFNSILLIRNLRLFKKTILSYKNQFDILERSYDYFIYEV